MRFAILTSFALLAGAAHAEAPSPERFFVGRLESAGRLKIIFRAAEAVRDHGSGRLDADGTTVLDQMVERPGEPARRRIWRLREISPGVVAGTLTGAKSGVKGFYAHGVLRLNYVMDDGVRVVQSLTFAPDGLSARNTMSFRKFGLNVATLEGTIHRVAVE
ncbi:MAG: hypothetical protein ACOYLK_07145 [Sphingomonas sp.]